MKLRKINYAFILSSALTAKVIISQTWICVPSRSTDSTANGIIRNNKNFIKTEEPWFAQLWAVSKHDFEKYQNFLLKHS